MRTSPTIWACPCSRRGTRGRERREVPDAHRRRDLTLFEGMRSPDTPPLRRTKRRALESLAPELREQPSCTRRTIGIRVRADALGTALQERAQSRSKKSSPTPPPARIQLKCSSADTPRLWRSIAAAISACLALVSSRAITAQRRL